jgi:hypothetical protein
MSTSFTEGFVVKDSDLAYLRRNRSLQVTGLPIPGQRASLNAWVDGSNERGMVTARRWIPWSLVVGLTVVALLAAALAGPGSAPNRVQGATVVGFGPPSGFGGYQTETSADQISAQWRVPAVLPTSPMGFSATWIGLQTKAPGGPFIQLGTYADQSIFSPPGQSRKAMASYGIFWSDTARAYRPVSVVELSRPGDLISFDMTRNDQGWYLKVHNLTVGWSRSVEVHYGASDQFTQAEWFQEDPANGYAATTDVPYPSTSPVAFAHLEVDRHPPRLRYSDAQVLSTVKDVFLVPTPPRDDGFALLPPSGVALQFLTDLESFDAAVTPVNLAYYEDLLHADSTRLPSVAAIAQPMTSLAEDLDRQSWPLADKGKVDAFVKDLGQNVRALEAWGRTPDKSWINLAIIVHRRSYLRDRNRLRLSLGLPPSYR